MYALVGKRNKILTQELVLRLQLSPGGEEISPAAQTYKHASI
jgi:hypothetical protein